MVRSIWAKHSSQSESVKIENKSEGASIPFSRAKLLRTFHNELPIIPKRMSQRCQVLQPILCPLLRTIGPATRPFRFAPRVSNNDKPLPVALDGTKDGVRVVPDQAFYFGARNAAACAVQCVEGTSKEAVFICPSELFVPEATGIKDILAF